MAYAEDSLTRAAKKNNVGIIKLGNASEYSHYADYLKTHPGSGAGGLTPLKSVTFPYDPNSHPKTNAEAVIRRKQFKDAKREWSLQLLNQFKRLDKKKPLVLHFGNHGINTGKSPEDSSALCMHSSVSSGAECLTYREVGDLMVEAGLTGSNAPPVRIVGDHCYSGGVHSIAMRFPNVCSASNVSSKTLQWSPDSSYGSEDAINTFGQTFWNTVFQDGGANTSLADSFQSAWSVVPKENNPGGTLSSIFYAQQIMGWGERDLPTEARQPDLAAMEKNYNAAENLFADARTALQMGYKVDDFSKPATSCFAPNPKPLSPSNWEPVLHSLLLDRGMNTYRDAVTRASRPDFARSGKKNVESLNQCWQVAKVQYDRSEPAIKEFIEKNGNWAWKNVFRSQSEVEADNSRFRRGQVNNYANKILNDLRGCVASRQSAAREYLNTLQTLNTLSRLSEFSKKASVAQKSEFRKKVECESSPLL